MTDRWNTRQEDQDHSDSTIRAAEEAMFPEPAKPKRPAYRPMWEQAERELAAVRALLETERTTSRYYWRNLKGFALVALAEAVTLLILVAR